MTNAEEMPPYITPRIKAAPKIRQIYWCEFWKDARLPEMWKTRPVIVISYKHTLHGHCLIVPTSSLAQDDNDWAYKLSIAIEGDGIQSWAICNQPYTVSTSRLTQFRGEIPFLPKKDFNQVLEKLMKWLPQPFSLEEYGNLCHIMGIYGLSDECPLPPKGGVNCQGSFTLPLVFLDKTIASGNMFSLCFV